MDQAGAVFRGKSEKSGCKLDPKLISALVERWRPETHTFNLPCDLLGAIPKTIYEGQIEMAWIRQYFTEMVEDSTKVQREQYARERANSFEVWRIGDIVPGDMLGDTTNENQNWWLPFTTTIMGSVLISIFTSLSELSIYIPLITRWNNASSHVGLPTELQDIRFSLDRLSEAKDSAIQAVIPDEFFVNPNAWHVEVILVVYATVKMHEIDRVLW
ncbi:hypothetical protein CXB51_025761 [Gossypium anomalum]|uniref:Aminotransferase-like plant mobile domain-containing protein n=1 Tax=Gossypium anomalum TaxID=47600 RepID=A0A8J5YAP8_9ROSI|nr:hypothetical protein CXB51_025761 [Gossypium anomalum]